MIKLVMDYSKVFVFFSPRKNSSEITEFRLCDFRTRRAEIVIQGAILHNNKCSHLMNNMYIIVQESTIYVRCHHPGIGENDLRLAFKRFGNIQTLTVDATKK